MLRPPAGWSARGADAAEADAAPEADVAEGEAQAANGEPGGERVLFQPDSDKRTSRDAGEAGMWAYVLGHI